MKRTPTLLALAVAAGFGIAGVTGFSSATFVSGSANASSVTAASDWAPPTVSLSSPGATVRGTVTVVATAADDRSGIASVQLQVRAAGAPAWTTICTTTTAPFSCSWDTAGLPDGAHDLQAVATDKAGYVATSSTVRTTVANLTVVTLADPGDVVRGPVTLQASISAGTGWTIRFERAPIGTTTFTTICSGATTPYRCAWSTAGTPNGRYDLRAVATSATTTITSPVVLDTLIDNLAPTVALADPGTFLEGTVNLEASATSTAAIASVVFQRAPTGTGTWATACTATVAPWSCPWDTTGLPDGTYDLRAVLTDVNGTAAASNVVAARKVDNVTTPLKALDVQSTNGNGNPNRIDKGDRIVMTYSRRVDLNTITPDWNGGTIPINLTITKPLQGGDDLVLTRPGSPFNLGTVHTTNSFGALTGFDVTLSARLTATPEIVNGVPRTVVTVEVGDLVSGSLRTVSRDNTFTWSPSSQVFGLNGLRLASAPAVESGPDDRDF